MSESYKMGLFGSKDKTKDTKKEATKEDSPERYAPYSMDSDSETYDTEALSIMDINDIIGVQSEPVSDSTLESEIAALSQIITDSKNEVNQEPGEAENSVKCKKEDSIVEEKAFGIVSSDIEKRGTENELVMGIASDQTEEVFFTSKVTDTNSEDKVKLDTLDTVLETLDLNNEANSSTSCGRKTENDLSEPTLSIPVSSFLSVNDTKVEAVEDDSVMHIEKSNPKSDRVIAENPIVFEDTRPETSQCNPVVDQQIDQSNKPSEMENNKDTAIVESISTVGGSLQLIGEAYTSEDSQEGISMETDAMELTLSKALMADSTKSNEQTESSMQPCSLDKEISSIKEDAQDPQSTCKSAEDTSNQTDTITEDVAPCIEAIKVPDELPSPVNVPQIPVPEPEKINSAPTEAEKNDQEDVLHEAKETNADGTEKGIVQEDSEKALAEDKTEELEKLSVQSQEDEKEKPVSIVQTPDTVDGESEVQEERVSDQEKLNSNMEELENLKNSPAPELNDTNVEEAVEVKEVEEPEEAKEPEETREPEEAKETKNQSPVPMEVDEDKHPEQSNTLLPDAQSMECTEETAAEESKLKHAEICTNEDLDKKDLVGPENLATEDLESLDKTDDCKPPEESSHTPMETKMDLELQAAKLESTEQAENTTLLTSSEISETKPPAELVEEISKEEGDEKAAEINTICSAAEDAVKDTSIDRSKENDETTDTVLKSPISTAVNDAPCEPTLEETEAKENIETEKESQGSDSNCIENVNITVDDVAELKEKVINQADAVEADAEKICSTENIETSTNNEVHMPEEIELKTEDETSTQDEPAVIEEKDSEECSESVVTATEKENQAKASTEHEMDVPEENEGIKSSSIEEKEDVISSSPMIVTDVIKTSSPVKEQDADQNITEIIAKTSEESIVMAADDLKQTTSNIVAGNIEEMENEPNAGNLFPDNLYMSKNFSPVDQHSFPLPDEEAEEEKMEEEMHLTLESEGSESQVEITETEQVPDEAELKKAAIEEVVAAEASEGIKDNEMEALKNESRIEACRDSGANDASDLPKEVEKLENSENLEESAKNDELIEDNSLNRMFDSTNSVSDLFAQQSQNTQNIVTSILSDMRNVTDFKNILGNQNEVESEMQDDLEESSNLPLEEPEVEQLSEKLPASPEEMSNKDTQDSIAVQNLDAFDTLLDLDLLPEGEESGAKVPKSTEENQKEVEKNVDMELLLQQSDRSVDGEQSANYMSNVISRCLTPTGDKSFEGGTGEVRLDEVEDAEDRPGAVDEPEIGILKKVDDSKDLSEDIHIPENNLNLDFESTPLESVDDLEAESKLDLTSDMLLQSVDPSEPLTDPPLGAATSQASSEISELESAVKFLQESEEQVIDSPLELSPKMVESVVSDISKEESGAPSLFVHEEDIVPDASELVAELQDIETDSISISEAEIISEAAKLENEKKLAEQAKATAVVAAALQTEDNKMETEEMRNILPEEDSKFKSGVLERIGMKTAAEVTNEAMLRSGLPTLSQNVLKISENIPKVSILEERLKEPPKIEIPMTDVTKVTMSPTIAKDSLLIQKDAKLIAYQKMLESPKSTDKGEPRITDTPRKDSTDKHDFENVGSPRIILKIAKSAIADCGEPRSPKSPKIRSATNSPNPEDSPGQKLGKIKLKLSKSGHPSIISNETFEETTPWHSESTSALSPIGMKIKFSKSGDASIVSTQDKNDVVDEAKEGKHKFEEGKRTESPLGMKIKFSKSGDASIVQEPKEVTKHKEKLDIAQGSPKRTESPLGMKIKLSKSGDASIIQFERQDLAEENRENTLKSRDLSYDSPKRTESPIGMKIKLSKSGDASIVSPDTSEEMRTREKLESPPEVPKRTDSPMGMKIKLAKTKGGASIIPIDSADDVKEKLDIPDVPKRTDSPLGMKIKLSKTGDASIIHSELSDDTKDFKQKDKDNKEKLEAMHDTGEAASPCGVKIKVSKTEDAFQAEQLTMQDVEGEKEVIPKAESPLGMKIKLSKFGDASIIPIDKPEQTEESRVREPLQETPKRTDSPLGMKIKLSKTGDASIIQNEACEDPSRAGRVGEQDPAKSADSALGMKIKLLKTGDASIVDPEKKERQQRRRDTESPLEMKIKLSKTGHPTIVPCDSHTDSSHKSKESSEAGQNFPQRYKEQATQKESTLKMLKTAHSTILQGSRSELTIEPIQVQNKKTENATDISPKRKEITISPIESKKSKLETQLSQILPEVTIQPVMSRDQKQLMFDPKTSLISRQQMNVISQEISITQVRPSKPEAHPTEKLKEILSKNMSNSPLGSDCEIIEHRPELIIVNENSNSSQDVMIIEEVPANRTPEVKVPKKRGRPRRNPLAQPMSLPTPQILVNREPLVLDDTLQAPQFEHRENERPKRTCRNQKSYAPPKRGRGRGRGKRKLEAMDMHQVKKIKVDQDLNAIEASTMAVITLDEAPGQHASLGNSELYKALKQPTMDSKNLSIAASCLNSGTEVLDQLELSKGINTSGTDVSEDTPMDTSQLAEGEIDSSKVMPKPSITLPLDIKEKDKKPEIIGEKGQKQMIKPGVGNWLTPSSKRQIETGAKQENLSTVQVIDEETRMSAESCSRSQTPARNIPVPTSDHIVNEESQGSVLSTATTESEKVKVKNRRMEINFDPDEGPFTVDKIAEYEWPLDRKGETFMIQEQISQYLGVKSFKRKYPDLKRRVVDMEERNYLRENGLVSEAMCDMGLTAICSSEVLDIMCSDFPDQYEEYRKHMREKQVKEHSKKQKELTAAATAEKNRIDLAEMAVQSALAWNMNLNKARKENRKCSLDLQTFTIHVPKKQQKVDADRKVSHYPVTLIPGQYTDYYREYTPAELRYYPLNTVLYGPTRPNERKFDSQSEGSQSDSDSESSSDDSSSSSSEGTQDTEGSQSTMDDVDIEIVAQKEEVKLKCKMCLKTLNKNSESEVLIQCGTCNGHVHPSCIDLTLDMVPHIQSYAWQCTDCKTCAQCHDPADEDKMLFCDMCDRGYHIYCVGLRRVPQGRWHCQECAVCANCGSRGPSGLNSDRNSVAQWQHEYKKGDKNTRVYVSTLCVPCSKLWRKGRYCPHCSRCHTAQRLDLEANLVHCSACDKYLHLGCVETKGQGFDRKNYLCDFCAPNRQQVNKPMVSRVQKT